MKKHSRLVWGMASVLSISMLFTGCGNQSSTDKAEENRVVVDVMTAQNGTLTLSNQFVGMVAPEESVYIIPMAQGTVTNTYFEVGDTVKAGDVLFEIDNTAAKLQLEQAELTYRNTQSQLDSSWDSANTQKDSAISQLEAQRTASLAQLQAAQIQYFTLKDSVEAGEGALNAMKSQHDSIDTMTADEVLKLAKSMLETMASGSSSAGNINLGDILGNGNNLDWESILNGTISEEDKDKLANELRPTLKTMLANQISETETGMKQAKMSLNTAETSMNAALEAFEIIENSLYDTVNTNLGSTKEQLDNSLKLAGLGVKSAKLALSYYDVTTPISGTVISKSVTVNGIAAGSQPAYIIANDDTMTVTFSVSESVKNTLAVGRELSVERNGVLYKGVITEVGNAVNQQTGLFQVKGTVYADGEELPSGVSVKLSVETYKAENTIIIPYDAVYYESNGAYVYVMEDGVAVKTMVTTGIFDEENVEITSGIKLGDTVITSWSPRLLDGVSVVAAPSKEAAK